MTQKGILEYVKLPDARFSSQWDGIVVPASIKEQLLSLAVLEFTLRGKVSRTSIPLHGVILLVGPPGTGKTSLARGLANRVAEVVGGRQFHFAEVEPHALASAGLGRSQQAVRDLLQQTIGEYAELGPLIVLLDEVETLAADRRRLSLEANPVDVHRATDAVLASLDHLAARFDNLLFIATSNFQEALDGAFVSRADFVVSLEKPNQEACRAILLDTLTELGKRWPKMIGIADAERLGKAAAACVGLDGRQIRKAVVSACASSKETALDPGRLRVEDILRSIAHAKGAGT